MVRVQVSQRIDRPPDQVFRYVATEHFKNHPQWDPSIVELTQSSSGPMGAGTTAHLVRLDQGKRVEGMVEVVEYEPDRSFAAVARFGPFVLRQRADFEPVGADHTRLTLTIDTEAAGLMRFLLPLFKRTFARTMTTSLQRIDQAVVSGAADGDAGQ